MAIKDITGKRFGRLVVTKFSERKNGITFWECLCDCGTTKVLRSGNLSRTTNHTTSCGCFARETASKRNTKPDGLSGARRKYLDYIHSAKNRKHEFALTFDQWYKLTQQICHYCGVPPLQINTRKGYSTSFAYNGLDRVDNSIGYVINNVVPCCKVCNIAKRNMALEDFKAWVHRVHTHMFEI